MLCAASLISVRAAFRSTFSISNKLFNGDEGPFKRMRFSEDSEKTQWRRVSGVRVTMLHLTYDESPISFRGLEIGDKTILMVKSRTEIKSSHFEKK